MNTKKNRSFQADLVALIMIKKKYQVSLAVSTILNSSESESSPRDLSHVSKHGVRFSLSDVCLSEFFLYVVVNFHLQRRRKFSILSLLYIISKFYSNGLFLPEQYFKRIHAAIGSGDVPISNEIPTV